MNGEDRMDATTITDLSKRDLLFGAGGLMAALAASSCASAAAAPPEIRAVDGPVFPLEFEPTGDTMPWISRVFHLYSGPEGLTRAEQLTVIEPKGRKIATLLRRTAERVTVGASQAGAGFGFHVANNPTFLIPIFGSMIIGLHDGTEHELRHGDLAFAEDCTGRGHISRAGPQGSMMVAIQLPKAGCPKVGSSDLSKVWSE